MSLNDYITAYLQARNEWKIFTDTHAIKSFGFTTIYETEDLTRHHNALLKEYERRFALLCSFFPSNYRTNISAIDTDLIMGSISDDEFRKIMNALL